MTGNNELMRELVDAFNFNNYYSEVATNFVVEDGNIVIPLDCDPSYAEKYLVNIKEEIIKRHFGNEHDAGKFYDLASFPFDFDKRKLVCGEDGRAKKCVISMDSGVVFNFKRHFSLEFERAVKIKILGVFTRGGVSKEAALKTLEEGVNIRPIAMSPPDKYCLSISDQRLRHAYVQVFEDLMDLRYDCNASDFYEVNNDGELSFENIGGFDFVKKVANYVTTRIARDFRTLGTIDSRVENLKNAMNDIILDKAKVRIDLFYPDELIAEDEDGHKLAVIPAVKRNGQLESLSNKEADRINEKFGNVLTNVRGQTKNIQFAHSEEPLYAFSNKQLALLIPEIMKSPIGYNETSKRFEYAVDLGNFYKSREHSDLEEDLDLILTRKFIPKDGKVRDYIWNCLSKSGFGLDGYDESELIEFVDKKIEEQKIVEKQLKGDLDRILMPKFTDGDGDGYVDLKGIKKVSDHILNSGFGCNGYSESDLEAEIGKYLQPIVRPSFLDVPTTNPMSDSVHSEYSTDSGRGTDSQSGSPERKRPRDSTDSAISGSNLSLATSEAKLLLDQYQQHGSSSGKIALPLQQLKPISRDYGDNVASSGIKPLLDQCQHGSSSGKIASPLQQLKPISRDYADNLPTSKTEPSLNQYSSFGKTCSPRLGAEVMYNEVIFPHVDHKIKEIEVGVAPENKLSYYGESDFSSQQSHLSNGDPVFSSQQKSHGSFGRKTSKTIKAAIATVNEVSVKQKLNSSGESHRDKELRKREEKQKKSERCTFV